MVGAAAAGWITTGDGAIGIAHDAGAAVGHHDEDAVAVVPAPHTLQALLCCGVAQPPESTYMWKSISHLAIYLITSFRAT